MRALLALAAAVLVLPGLAAANEPYVQSATYVAGYNCCTFGIEAGDSSARFLLLDALSPLGLAPGAHVEFHGTNHNPLQPAMNFCGESPLAMLVEHLDHMHVYLLTPADQLATCGAAAGPGGTVGTVEVHLNGA